MTIFNRIKGPGFSATILSILFILILFLTRTDAESACVTGNGNIINNVGWFSISACETPFGNAIGSIVFVGQVVHSGNQNVLVGAEIKFDGSISKLTINGPYAGYEGAGTLTLCDQAGVCTVYANSTLFPAGSNVKDTAKDRRGYTRGFDDFNISIIYGNNEFVTANGFVEYCYDANNNVIKDCISINP